MIYFDNSATSPVDGEKYWMLCFHILEKNMEILQVNIIARQLMTHNAVVEDATCPGCKTVVI